MRIASVTLGVYETGARCGASASRSTCWAGVLDPGGVSDGDWERRVVRMTFLQDGVASPEALSHTLLAGWRHAPGGAISTITFGGDTRHRAMPHSGSEA